MAPRKPIVASQFYPDGRDGCVTGVTECLAEAPKIGKLPETIVAGIVPHAGWMFSGHLAGLVFSAVKQVHEMVETFVIFGAIHSYSGSSAAVYDKGGWATPLGKVAIDEQLAAEIIKAGPAAKADCNAHSSEHSIEVQLPFIQHLFAGAKILPIMVPPAGFAAQFGSDVADVIRQAGPKKIICIGSTDLTHYGPRYGFCPAGVGAEGIKWAKEVNDRDFINLALAMQADKIVENAMEKTNACGAGAAAATVAAAKQLGKTKGLLLAHTHSNEVMQHRFGQTSAESVGYAAIVY